jgi:hypothetical protein
MDHLKGLKKIAFFCLLANSVQNRVDECCSLVVVSFGPVVACAVHANHKVVRVVEATVGSSASSVDGSWFEVNKNGSS